ncbi:hypothetical protein BDQ12DRAFT_673949 [Crucibulum laeve]|uniref:GST N-terminal domain-containing protein n=1 Tax=Crucibulum laeve TaxID=68775 RepID=A0A5C3MJD5_9AGAR|nr:hypothetical protein BDQ12DRAFT_673949 [Crucibulum laeve]
MITFYDIPSQLPQKAWSPNTWKARYCLNYKGIPYRTEWIEFPDIEAKCSSLGIPPTSHKFGKDHYTLPAIHDPTTGISLADSIAIAEYLDTTYPDTPIVFPSGTAALQYAFLDAYLPTLRPFWRFSLPVLADKLNPPSAEYFIRTRSAMWGKSIRDVLPSGEERVEEWKKAKESVGIVDGWLKKNGEGPFIMGATPCFADFFVGGCLTHLKSVLGEDSEEWKDITTWHNGRWKAFLDGLKEYQAVI